DARLTCPGGNPAEALAHRTGPGVAGPERCAGKRIGSAKDRRSVDDMLERVRRDNQIADLALSPRKQGFESPRERQLNQLLVPSSQLLLLSFSNFSPNQ